MSSGLSKPDVTLTPSLTDSLIDPARPYRVGTLSYGKASLIALMLWLLWGDFCFILMESVAPSILPFTLKNLDAPNWLIAVILGTIPNFFNSTVCPGVSFWSDRFRSAWGRRVPFLAVATPFIALFLILMGFAPQIAHWVTASGWFSDARVATLSLIALFMIGFQIFNMVVASIYYYLFNDVVPREFLGRFMAVFRVVGTIAQSGFMFFIFPHAETHSSIIFFGGAVLYAVIFGLMCLNVKEGKYPPPPPSTNLVQGTKTFFVESYTRAFYWKFHLVYGLWAAAGAGGMFQLLFAKSIGLTMDQIGFFAGTCALISAALLIPAGYLVDRFHPIRMMLLAVCAAVFFSTFPLVFLFFDVPSDKTFLVWCVVFGAGIPLGAVYAASEIPLFMRILPLDRYGQFSSATALVRSVTAMTAGLVVGFGVDVIQRIHNESIMSSLVEASTQLAYGINFDAVQRLNPNSNFAYRCLPFWTIAFQIACAAMLWSLYREWKQLGGDAHYQPPSVKTLAEVRSVASATS